MREVFRIVAQMRAEGITVLLVEQNVRMSLEIADHAYVLDDGHVVYSGPAHELAADEARVQALAGASAEEWTPPRKCRAGLKLAFRSDQVALFGSSPCFAHILATIAASLPPAIRPSTAAVMWPPVTLVSTM